MTEAIGIVALIFVALAIVAVVFLKKSETGHRTAEPEEPEPESPLEPEEPEQPEPKPPEEPEEPEQPAPEPSEELDEPEQPAPEPSEELDEPEQPAPEPPEELDKPEQSAPELPEEPEPEAPQEPEQPEPEAPEKPEEPERPEPELPSDPAKPVRIAPYVPSVRTPETTKRRPKSQDRRPSSGRRRRRTLLVSVRVVFGRGRRSTVQVSLLPARGGGLPEEIVVTGSEGDEIWFACQDEWYGDFTHSDIGKFLEHGTRWTSDEATWVLRPGDVFVLAPASTIFGFVSATRLLLNEDQLVLCRESVQEAVCEELDQAGCNTFECTVGNGVPDDWMLFSKVHPINPVDHEESAGILNVLRPVDEVEIFLTGGIRLTHNKWLVGHQPRIRIRGSSGDIPEVSVDGEAAGVDDESNFTTAASADLGQHIVFCEGVTASYDIVDGQEDWDRFIAYAYRIDRKQGAEVDICGPIVMGNGEQSLMSATNRALIGAQPGQVYFCNSPYGQSTNELLGVTDFPVAWALPDNPYQCNKKRVFAKLVASVAVGPIKPYLRCRPTHDLLRWCDAILNSSRKGLRVDPSDNSARELWAEYVRAARQIRRSIR